VSIKRSASMLLLLLAAAAPQADPSALDPKSDLLSAPYLRPEKTTRYGYLELAVPKSFQNDGRGTLKTKPVIQDLSVTVSDPLRDWLAYACEELGTESPGKDWLKAVCAELAEQNSKSRIVPYMDRYLAAGGKPSYAEMVQYVPGLVALGRSSEAMNHYYASALRWGGMTVNIAAELYGARFQAAWYVEKSFAEMTSAFRDGMKRGIFPADRNGIQETICEFVRLAGERKELPWFAARLEKDWIWINERRLGKVMETFTKAGLAVPESLLTAADPLFKGTAVAPEALGHRAVASLDAGETDLAVRQAERGYELGKASSPGQHFQALVILARILRQRGDLERTYLVTEELEQVAKQINEPPERGWALVIRGFILERLSDYRRAADCHAQAMRIGESLGYTELRDSAKASLARAVSHTGMAGDVEPTLRANAEAALAHRQFAQVPEQYSNWGECLLQLRRYDEALKAFQQALEPVKGVGAGFNINFHTQVTSHKGVAASLYGLEKYAEAEKAYDAYAGLVAKAVGTAYDWVWQLGKAKCRMALKDSAGAQRLIDQCLGSIEAERASLKDFQNRRSLNDNKYEAYELALRLALETRDIASAYRIAERARARSFLDEMGSHSGEAASIPPADLAALAESCRDESMVIYFELADRILAWVVTGGKAELVTIEIGFEELLRYIENFLYAIYLQSLTLQDKAQVFGPKPDVINSGKGLAFLLWSPVAAKLPPGKPVCIVAHRLLHYIPFQALREGKQYLIEQREMFYAPSGTAYLELKRRRCNTGRKVLVFDPILSDDPRSIFAKTESAGLKERYPEGTFILKRAATVESFRKEAADAGIIHVSSHGQYNPWVPMASGLLFAGTGDQEHALLSAKDVYGMTFKQTELIVMSACVSSVGDFATGDDVTGLTRAFQVAGVPNVIGSLWPVENDATTELMVLFHQALAETKNPSVALRKAQMQMIAGQKLVVKWGAFELTGLGGALQGK